MIRNGGKTNIFCLQTYFASIRRRYLIIDAYQKCLRACHILRFAPKSNVLNCCRKKHYIFRTLTITHTNKYGLDLVVWQLAFHRFPIDRCNIMYYNVFVEFTQIHHSVSRHIQWLLLSCQVSQDALFCFFPLNDIASLISPAGLSFWGI